MSRELGNPFQPPPKLSADSEEVAGRLLVGGDKMWRRARGRERVRPEPDLSLWNIDGFDVHTAAVERAKKLQPGEFMLEQDVLLTKLPSDEDLLDKGESGYKFDYINNEAKNARSEPLSSFALMPRDLDGIGITDPETRAFLLSSVEEGPVIGKLISTQELVDEFRAVHPSRRSEHDIVAILTQLYLRGYRPGSLSQALTYARDHWSPIEESELSEDQKTRKSFAKKIACLGALLPSDKRLDLIPAEERDISWFCQLESNRDKFTREYLRDLSVDIFELLTADDNHFVLAVRGIPVPGAVKM